MIAHFRFTDDGMQHVADDGTVTRAYPVPFQVKTLFGNWRPICVKHKLIFKNEGSHYEHWTPQCDNIKLTEYPSSDMKWKLKGYSDGPKK
jgi:hypothetical protein